MPLDHWRNEHVKHAVTLIAWASLTALVPTAFGESSASSRFLGGAVPEDIPSPLSQMAHWAAARDSLATTEQLDLPHHFDWREQEDGSYMPAIETQGDCGSCVSIAAVAALEAQLNIACRSPDRPFALSHQYFFSCGGGSCKSGWKLSDAVTFMTAHGVPDAGCLPYLAGDRGGDDVPCDMACSDAAARLVQGIVTQRPTAGYIDVPVIKKALQHGPLLANLILFEDLRQHKTGVYRHKTGLQLGSHAVVLVGWDDDDKAWIARNSWGEDWGENGYFRIAWDDTSLPGRYTWSFDVSSAKSRGACSLPR